MLTQQSFSILTKQGIPHRHTIRQPVTHISVTFQPLHHNNLYSIIVGRQPLHNSYPCMSPRDKLQPALPMLPKQETHTTTIIP